MACNPLRSIITSDAVTIKKNFIFKEKNNSSGIGFACVFDLRVTRRSHVNSRPIFGRILSFYSVRPIALCLIVGRHLSFPGSSGTS